MVVSWVVVRLSPLGSSDPQPCTPGKFCKFDGLSTPDGPCSAGSYCSARSSSATPTDGTTGDTCPPGFYCIEGSSAPQPCKPGTYSPSSGNQNETDCLVCSYGEWCGYYNLTATSGELLGN